MSKTLVERLLDIADDDSYCGVDAGRTNTCNATHWLEQAADCLVEQDDLINQLNTLITELESANAELQRKHTELLNGLEDIYDSSIQYQERHFTDELRPQDNTVYMKIKRDQLRALIAKVKA